MDDEDLDIKHELKDIDTSGYTTEFWFEGIKSYLVDVMGMNERQVKKEFDTRFPELLSSDLDLFNKEA